VFISENVSDRCSVSLQTGEVGYIFPLYLYQDDGSKISNLNVNITENFKKIINKIEPENIFDYIYVILHSPNFRKKYKEFLKIDFPRIPYPKNETVFWQLVEKGKKLRELHLMTDSDVCNFVTSYPVSGDDVIIQVKYFDSKVVINDQQYFGNIPNVAWSFYIGGYQPALKWLKDRKGRILSSNDIEHYQKIIKVLVETDRVMKEIDNIDFI
jgi:predicted helicase